MSGKVVAAITLGTLVLIVSAVLWLGRGEPFPFDSLVVDEGSIHTSLHFNPYSDYPPKLRWEIGVSFKELQPPGSEKPDTTFISYTVDLGISDWRSLSGEYQLDSKDGSDMWINGVNYGLVDLKKITVTSTGGASFNVTLDLTFNFEETPFRKERRFITFHTDYEGMRFLAPVWNDPLKVNFPSAWKIPSVKPHWSDEEVRKFVSRHVDLSSFATVTVDQAGDCTVLEAKP